MKLDIYYEAAGIVREINRIKSAIKDWEETSHLGRADGYTFGGGDLSYRKFHGAAPDQELVKVFVRSVVLELKDRLVEKEKQLEALP